jgi:hypothetical protein
MTKPVKDAFYFLGPPGLLDALEAETARHSGAIGEAASSFKGNLQAALSVASIPFLMAHQAATSQRFASILVAERIRARSHRQTTDTKVLDHWAQPKAHERFEEELATEEGKEHLQTDILGRLEGSLNSPEFQRASEELLNETLVMVWGAFEAFVADVVRAKLNLDPSAAVRLVTFDPVRKHFRKEVPIETLASHDFDLNRAMGDVLLNEQQLDSLPRMRDVLTGLLPGARDLHDAMAARSLWLLWQHRHVIVHRRGVVDAHFIANTGETAAPGSRITIIGDDVDEAARTVSGVAAALLSALQPA